jgi:hypothetical protein
MPTYFGAPSRSARGLHGLSVPRSLKQPLPPLSPQNFAMLYFAGDPGKENMPPKSNTQSRSQSDGLTGRSQSEVNRERSRLARWRPKKDKRKVIRKKNQKRIKKKSSSFTFTPRYTRVNVKVKV